MNKRISLKSKLQLSVITIALIAIMLLSSVSALTTIKNDEISTVDIKFTGDIYWDSNNRTDVLAYPESEASYIVFKDGSLYKAKNGATGQIDFQNTNATLVYENCRNTLTSGGDITFKKGNYPISIILNQSYITLQAESRSSVSFEHDNGKDIITLKVPSGKTTLDHIEIIGFAFEGGTGSGNAITSDVVTGTSHLRGINIGYNVFSYFNQSGKYAIYAENPEEWRIAYNRFVGCGANQIKMVTDGYDSGNVLFWSNELFGGGNNDKTMVLIEATGGCDFFKFTSLANHWSMSGTTNVTAFKLFANGANVGDFSSISDRFESVATAYNFVGTTNKYVRTVNVDDAFIYNGNDETNIIQIIVDDYTFGIKIHDSDFCAESANYVTGIWVASGATPIPIIHGNTFSGFSGTGSIAVDAETPVDVYGNRGFVTENSGTQTVANGETVNHGLASTPTTVTISARSATYGSPAVPFIVSVTARGTTTFTVGVYWVNSTAITNDAIVIDWYAIYKP